MWSLVVVTTVAMVFGIVLGARLGVRWALDQGLAAADRLQVGDQWIREVALRQGFAVPGDWRRKRRDGGDQEADR